MVNVLRLARLLHDIQDARRSIKVHLGPHHIVIQVIPLSLLVETFV